MISDYEKAIDQGIEEVTIDGEIYEIDDITKRTITVKCVQPTDHEEWQWLNVLCDLTNKKKGAKGKAQTIYRYVNLSHLPLFHANRYPFKVSVLMTSTTDKNGEPFDHILFVDFDSIDEVTTISRKKLAQLMQLEQQAKPAKPARQTTP